MKINPITSRSTVLSWLLLAAGAAACINPEATPANYEQETQASDWPASFGFGRDATAEDIEAWDIDVRPDGEGLPEGHGTVPEGEVIYQAKCAVCHGPTGIEGPNDRLVGRLPGDTFSMDEDLSQRQLKAIGSYWPYSTTLFDYIRRAMPQPMPGSLTDDEVYALTAYLLYLNNLVPADAVMGRETLPAVQMPARDLFLPDDRLDYNTVH